MDRKEIKDIIKDTLEERFPEIQIEKISVRHDFDDDGNNILNIIIVLSGKKVELDRERLVGLVRHLKTNLTQQAVNGFPLLSFVKSNEARKLKLESV